jgi:hypothetical protein
LGVDYHKVTDQLGTEIMEEPVGYGADRMKSLLNRAREGRVNSVGIPALYLVSREQTAISEIRPWIGSEVSVAQFVTRRNLITINLSVGHQSMSIGHLTFDEPDGKVQLTAEKSEGSLDRYR